MGYLNVEIIIDPKAGETYPMRIESPAGEDRAQFRMPFEQTKLEGYLEMLDLASALPADAEEPALAAARQEILATAKQQIQEFGQQLFETLFPGNFRRLFDRSLDKSETQGADGVRLRLRLLPPELAVVPWEYLYDERLKDYLCLYSNRLLVRYPELPQPVQALKVEPPLRILVMIASPSNLPALNVAQEQDRLFEALADLRRTPAIELEVVQGQTYDALQQALWRGPWHIFHFIGHGRFGNDGGLALANEQGSAATVNAQGLLRLLTPHPKLRLVVLNTCKSATGDPHDRFSSLAAALVRGRIPAVIAMQGAISDQAAIKFTGKLYQALANWRPVDTALTDARIAISNQRRHTLEWGMPVLYMHADDSLLFHEQLPSPAWQAYTGSSTTREQPAPAGPPDPAVSPKPPALPQTDGRPASIQKTTDPPQQAASLQNQATQAKVQGAPARPPVKVRCVYRDHEAPVYALGWSPDGRRILSLDSTGAVHMWDAITGDHLRAVAANSSALGWSPDGGRLVLASREGTIRVCDATSGRTLTTSRGQSSLVEVVAWSPISDAIALGGSNQVRIWDAATRRMRTFAQDHDTLPEGVSVVTALAWSPDGTLLATGCSDGTVQVGKVTTRRSEMNDQPHADAVTVLAWSPTGRLLASASDDTTVQVWDVVQKKLNIMYTLHGAPVKALAWSPDGNYLASGGHDMMVQIWDVTSSVCHFIYDGHTAWISSVAWSPDGAYIASASADQTVQVWQVPSTLLSRALFTL